MVVDAWHHRFFFHGDVDRMWVSGGENALSEKCIAVCVSHIGYIRCGMVAPRSIRDHWSVSRPFLHVQCDGHTVGESVTTGGNDSAVVGRVDTTSGTAIVDLSLSLSSSLSLSPLFSHLSSFSSSSPSLVLSHPLTTLSHTTRLCASPPCPPSRTALTVLV